MYATIVEEKDIGKIIYVKFESKEKEGFARFEAWFKIKWNF